MKAIRTDRLKIRQMTVADAPFMLRLLNEPSFLRFIGDRGVRTVQDARGYIEDGPRASYRENGFGLYLVEVRETGEPVGICGLVDRGELDDVDIGFAFLPEHWRKGFAIEASQAVLEQARNKLGFNRVVAIASSDNRRSFKLLRKLGLEREGTVHLANDGEELSLYSIDFSSRVR